MSKGHFITIKMFPGGSWGQKESARGQLPPLWRHPCAQDVQKFDFALNFPTVHCGRKFSNKKFFSDRPKFRRGSNFAPVSRYYAMHGGQYTIHDASYAHRRYQQYYGDVRDRAHDGHKNVNDSYRINQDGHNGRNKIYQG